MQAQVIPFSFKSRPVRTVLIDDQPWFVAADVCRILGQSNTTKALKSLDDDERSNLKLGRQGSSNIINESGLYTLILRCDDAIKKGSDAHSFRKWVTAEVLPAIRKHGRYDDNQGKMATLIGQTIGTDGFHVLSAVVAGKVRALPREIQRRATMKLWAQVHAAFNVRSAEDIPAAQLDSARNFIAAYALEGEWLPKEHSQPGAVHYPAEWLAANNPHAPQCAVVQRNGRRSVHLSVRTLVPCEFKSPIWSLIRHHKAEGANVEALELELKAYRHIIQSQSSLLDDLVWRCSNAKQHAPFFSVG